MGIKGGELESILSDHPKIQAKEVMEVYWSTRGQIKDKEDCEQQRSEKFTWQLAPLLIPSGHQNVFSRLLKKSRASHFKFWNLPSSKLLRWCWLVALLFEKIEIGQILEIWRLQNWVPALWLKIWCKNWILQSFRIFFSFHWK